MYDDILYIVPRVKALQFFDDTVIHLSHKQSVVLQIAILQCIFRTIRHLETSLVEVCIDRTCRYSPSRHNLRILNDHKIT